MGDITWNFVKPAIWTAAEPSLGIVSACIPSLRPLVTYVISGTHRGPTMESVKTSSTALNPTTWRTSESTEARGAFIQLDESTNEIESAWGHSVFVHGGHPGSKNGDNIDEVEIPIEGITVKTEITLMTSDRLNYNDRLF
ncbi:hypothetical protein MMC31_000802 [Peltigera leucophlebia]|nr:hypothetical protein [Peltigera leucophlebia]